jgi:pyruvyltransferase
MSEIAVWSCPDNFGDLLGPEILNRLGYRVRTVEDMKDAELLACGSIIDMVAPVAREGCMVWGSGLMRQEAVDVSHLDVRAVRGKLTTQALGLPEPVPTGDPGVLVPLLWDRPPTRHRIGVVRHYVDTEPYPWADAEISTRASVDEVIEVIGSCARIVSSSLHGLVVASAWDIPCVRAHHPGVLGGNFKWLDWMSGDGDPDELISALP